MPTIHDHGVCIRTWDWSETSQTVCILAREHGMLRALAKGSRRERSPYSGGLEVLARGDLTAITKPAGTLHLLTAWDLTHTYPGCRRDLARFHAGMYLADLTGQAVHDEDPHPQLFDALTTALDRIGGVDAPAGDLPVQRALLEYQWAVLVETGHMPVLDHHAETGREVKLGKAVGFSPRLGGIVDDPGPGATGAVWRVRAETIGILREVAGGVLGEGAQAAGVERAGRLLAWHLRERLEIDPPTLGLVYPEAGRRR